MKSKTIDDMRKYRLEMNKIILEKDNKNIKRFFALDSRAYEDGALDKKTKELMGLVSSLVMRCNDCIFYHLDQCYQNGVTEEEMLEAVNIGLIVGGSITIPHIRFLFEKWEELKK